MIESIKNAIGQNLEGTRTDEKNLNETEKLARAFRELPMQHSEHTSVFVNLEDDLHQEGFTLADETDASHIFSTNSLICRSESFSCVMNLLLQHHPIEILNEDDQANMCSMSSGEGFKNAMSEGFSGKDVDALVKVVITFSGEHLVAHNQIPHDKELWQLKPDSARVSLAGRGKIEFEDLEMVSFRFPIHFFPENLLSENEQERLEEDNVTFIVRHYIPDHKKTTH